MQVERNIEKKRMRVYELDEGWTVVVGKTDQDNDYLSLVFSEPNDYWFHVDGCPGAHVLLLHREGLEPKHQHLETAAEIAAYHSKARKALKVGVSMARAGDVGKSKGSPAGQVLVRKEKIYKVQPQLPNMKE